MLSNMRPVEDVGYYGAAYRILEVAMILPQSVSMAIYPQIVTAVQRDIAMLRRLGTTTLRYMTAFTLPTVACAIVLAGPGLDLLYGPAFSQAKATLAVLMLVLIPYASVRYHAYVLVSANLQKIDLALNVVMLAMNVALNLWLIPRYSHLGASMSTLVAIVIYAALQWYYLHKNYPGYAAPPPFSFALISATALAAALAWILRAGPLSLSIALAGLTYVLVLIRAGFFSQQELALMGVDRLLMRFKLHRR